MSWITRRYNHIMVTKATTFWGKYKDTLIPGLLLLGTAKLMDNFSMIVGYGSDHSLFILIVGSAYVLLKMAYHIFNKIVFDA